MNKEVSDAAESMGHVLIAASLCALLIEQVNKAQYTFPKESRYYTHFAQSLRDLQRLEGLLDNVGTGLTGLIRPDNTGVKN